MKVRGTMTTETESNRIAFDRDTFLSIHSSIKKVIVNPEKRVKKLLLRVVDMWTEVFRPENFKEETQKIYNTKAIDSLKIQCKELRELEK